MQSDRSIPARARRLTNAWRLALLVVLVLSSILFDAAKPVYAAAFLVNSTADAVDDPEGSGCATAAWVYTLRAAIQEANALPGADTITLPAGTYTLSLAGVNENASATEDLDIRSDITINGAGARTTIIQGGARLDETRVGRVFHVLTGASLAISGVTIRHGNTGATFGVANGPALFNQGTATISDAYITNNQSALSGNVAAAPAGARKGNLP